ncbi:MAG: thymidine phosphorylase, partial [Rhodococcus sp. (in: high G+C Gram-positive bacteria)]
MPDAVSIISAKRDGRVLDDEQIEWVIAEFTRGSVAPEQMSALAMAVLWRGLSRRELGTWTNAM